MSAAARGPEPVEAGRLPVVAPPTGRVPVAAPGDRVGQVLARLPGQRFDTAAIVAVCEPDGTLAGVVTIEQLFASPPGRPVSAVMDGRPPIVTPGADQERAAWQAVHHGQAALPVVDRDHRLQGVIAPRQLLEFLLSAHHEDLARLGGYLHSTGSARAATLESVPRRLWHRLPWLGLGLAGAMLAAGLLTSFETRLSELVLLAFFIPGIVYLADAVGTQTETIAIRALPLGIKFRQFAGREAVTGVLIGGLLGAVLLPVVAWGWGDLTVAIAVAIAVAAASAVATVVALGLPWLLHRFGFDPAFGSGPVATVVQDLLSLTIYLAVALLLLPS